MARVNAQEYFEQQALADDIKNELVKLAPKMWGCTQAQAYDLAEFRFNDFQFGDDGKLTHRATGLHAEHPQVLDYLQANSPHLVAVRPADVSVSDRAWLEGNLKARGEIVRRVGLEAATAEAQRYGLKDIADVKTKGVRPSDVDVPDNKEKKPTNPWAVAPENVDPATGRYSPAAISRQAHVVKALGIQKAAQIAGAVGSKIGDVRPRT
jgi:hypothetical protein